jgi:hypothetical protein
MTFSLFNLFLLSFVSREPRSAILMRSITVRRFLSYCSSLSHRLCGRVPVGTVCGVGLVLHREAFFFFLFLSNSTTRVHPQHSRMLHKSSAQPYFSLPSWCRGNCVRWRTPGDSCLKTGTSFMYLLLRRFIFKWYPVSSSGYASRVSTSVRSLFWTTYPRSSAPVVGEPETRVLGSQKF